MKIGKKRAAATATVAAALMMFGASAAWAAVGLPYTATVIYISGGDDGVKTPTFYTNASGKICVKPSLYVKADSVEGPSYNDNRYKVLLVRDLAIDKTAKTWNLNSDSDGSKVCVTGLDKNSSYFVRIKKTDFVAQQTLAGSAVISYS